MLIGMTAQPHDEKCPKCQSRKLVKLVSRVQRFRTEDQRVEHAADSIEGMSDPESSSAMRERVKELGKALDDDMSDEMEEMFEMDVEAGDE